MKQYLIVLAFLIICTFAHRNVIDQRRTLRANGMKDVCRLRPKTGRCKARFQRWFYSAAELRCKPFIYGGCDGNGNNFLSVGECKSFCTVDRPMFCYMGSDYGPCNGRVRRWYYNHDTRQCEIFLSSGCRGNRNHFISRSFCERTCKVS